MHIKDHSAAMKFFRTYDNVASKGKWKEFVDEMEFESMVQEPRITAQEPRIGLKPGGIVEPGVTHYAKKTGFAIHPESRLEGTKVAKEILDVKKVKVVGHLKELEQWIETNASKYTDVDKFYKDALEKFDKPKYEGLVRESVQKAQKNVRGPVKIGKHIYIPTPYGKNIPQGSRYSYKNLFELKGVDAGSKIRYVKDMMLINMMDSKHGNSKMIEFAENLDKVMKNDFKNLSDTDRRLVSQFTKKHLKATAAKPNLFRSYLNERHEGFEDLRRERSVFSQGVEADLRNRLKNPNISEAAKKKIRNTLDNISRSKKYHIQFKTEFPELFVDKPVKAPTAHPKKQEFFEFEHGISKGSAAINKLPETYNLRGRYMPSSFNYAKMLDFDNPLVDLMAEYRETKNPKLEKQIKDLVNKFNKQSAGYLDNLTIDFDRSTGSVIVNDKTPMYKVKDFADYKSQMAKNLKHSQAYLKTVEGGKFAFNEKIATSIIKKIGCPDFAAGGRVGFADGKNCFDKGLKNIENKNFKTKSQADNMLKLAETGSKSARLRALLGVWGLGGEAIIEGGIGAYKVLGKGVPTKIAWSESYWSYLDPRKYTGELSDLRKKDLEKSNPRIATYFDALGVLEKRDKLKRIVETDDPQNPFIEEQQKQLNQYDEIIRNFYGGPEGLTKMMKKIQPEVDEAEAIQAGRWSADAMPSTEVQADRKQKQAMKELMASKGVKTMPYTTKDKKPVYEIDKELIDADLKMFGDFMGFGWTPYGLGFGMQQMKPGIGDMKYNKDLGYRQIAEMMADSEARDRIAEAGGVSKMATGGLANLTRTVAPDSEGIMSLKKKR